MRLLPDTHLLLWAGQESAFLSSAARILMGDPGNELFFSAASIWEIAIKTAKGRPDFQIDAARFRAGLKDAGYVELPINADHVLAVARLPPIHKDPFDRLLVAQAAVEGLVLLTADLVVARYPGAVRRV